MSGEPDYEPDYDSMTAAMSFSVGGSSRAAGKGLFAKELLLGSQDLLEEVPLVSWPAPETAAAEYNSRCAFCEECMCIFVRSSPRAVRCRVAGCGARFCSSACSSTRKHKALCGGALPALRTWQARTALDSEYGAEALARCNAQIASDTAYYISECSLDPASALLNATRPWERLCSFPPDCELALRGGATAEDVSAVVRVHTQSHILELLQETMASADARAIADQLTSAPHCAGLLQRLLLNTFQWRHPGTMDARVTPQGPAQASAGAAPLRFSGVFVLMSCANHDCSPNVRLDTKWSLDADEEVDGQMPYRELCSMTMRTIREIGPDAELQLSYVNVEMGLDERRKRLAHWAFTCLCTRCKEEQQQRSQPAERNEGKGMCSVAGAGSSAGSENRDEDATARSRESASEVGDAEGSDAHVKKKTRL